MFRVPHRALRYIALAGILGSPLALSASHAAPTTHAATAQQSPIARLFALAARQYASHHAAVHAAQSVFPVVASGLNNPRHLRFGADGALYVAEAGYGAGAVDVAGTRGAATPPCITDPESGATDCFANTGSVARIVNPTTSDPISSEWVTGLPSIASAMSGEDQPPPGSEAAGPSDVAPFASSFNGSLIFGGRVSAEVVVQNITAGTSFSAQSISPAFGHTLYVTPNGSWKLGANISSVEYALDPDGQGIDSDPYALVWTPTRLIVADAAGNDLIDAHPLVDLTSLDQVFPNNTACVQGTDAPPTGAQSVPTTIINGPNHSFYVGELGGLTTGCARIWRFVPGQAAQLLYSGFTSIIDLTFDRAGNLYVLEIDPGNFSFASRIIKISPTGAQSIVTDCGLFAATGMVMGPDGYLYVSNNGILAGAGQVLRINPNFNNAGCVD